MFTFSTFLTFISSCIIIILIPGPAQALVLSNSISNGKKSGIVTGIGLNVATVFHAVIAALGLSAILATSALAFSIVKYIGAAYLIFIGIITFNSKNNYKENKKIESSRKVFLKAFLTGLLNPKVAIFFLAFLPQFVDISKGFIFIQFLVLGIILALLDIVYETILVILTGFASEWFVKNEYFTKIRQKITGTILIGLGIRLAFQQQK